MKILLAEDMDAITSLYELILAKKGHILVIANDGEECIKYYRQEWQKIDSKDNKLPFDLVILDVRMPKKDGIQVANEIIGMNKNQKIIFASAHKEELAKAFENKLGKKFPVLHKPFQISTFSNLIGNYQSNLRNYKKLEKQFKEKNCEILGRDLKTDTDKPEIIKFSNNKKSVKN